MGINYRIHWLCSYQTGTGLTPVDFSTLPVGATVFIYCVSLVGGTVAESTFPLIIRFVENAKQQRPRKVLSLSLFSLFSSHSPLLQEAIMRERKAVRLLLFITFFYIFSVQIFCWIPTGLVRSFSSFLSLKTFFSNSMPFWLFFQSALWFQFSNAGQRVMKWSGTNAWWVSLFEVGMAFQNAGFVMIKCSLPSLFLSLFFIFFFIYLHWPSLQLALSSPSTHNSSLLSSLRSLPYVATFSIPSSFACLCTFTCNIPSGSRMMIKCLY